MSNFVPHEEKTFRPREPDWLSKNVKKMLQNQNKIFKRYKKNGYKHDDKVAVDRVRNQCNAAIKDAKENHLRNLGVKLADPTTGQKAYWRILNKLLNKCKIPRIPPLFILNKFITDCKEKSTIFNNLFHHNAHHWKTIVNCQSYVFLLKVESAHL